MQARRAKEIKHIKMRHHPGSPFIGAPRARWRRGEGRPRKGGGTNGGGPGGGCGEEGRGGEAPPDGKKNAQTHNNKNVNLNCKIIIPMNMPLVPITTAPTSTYLINDAMIMTHALHVQI